MTVQAWVDRARGYLMSGQTETINILDSAYIPGDGQLSLRYELKGISQGTPLSAGRACFMSWVTTAATKVVEVTPSWDGAPDVSVASDTIVRVKPRFFDHNIFDAVNETLNELSSPSMGLYAIGQITFDTDTSLTVYDLSDAEGLIDVLRVGVTNESDLTDAYPALRQNQWSFRRVNPTAEYPTGLQLRLFDWPAISSATSLIVTYKRAFIPADDIDSATSSTLIGDGMDDLPALGAASRLLIPGEVRRNQLTAQGDTRRAEEVVAGSTLGAARAIRKLYQDRVNDEYARLMQSFPPVLR